MSKNYCFEFLGTRDMFLETLNQYPNNGKKSFYFKNYIVEITEKGYRFGVARGGHSGGYWFEPTITELNNKLLFSGQIQYIDAYSGVKGIKRIINIAEECCLFVILLPLMLIIKAYILIRTIIRKKRNQPVPKEETPESRLYYLMENLLNCTTL